MDIFISWSGRLSQKLANILYEFIPNIIQQAVPFISSEDIRKGKRWIVEIGSKLQKNHFGIICLTNENYREPWILFEAGALSKQIDESSVCTILFDELDESNLLDSPLSQFQFTRFNKTDFNKLFKDLNDKLGDNKLTEKILNKSFNTWWPRLQKKINETLKKEISQTNPVFKLLENEKPMDRLIRITEYIASSVARLSLPKESFDFAKFTDLTELTYLGETFNHPVRVRIFPFLKNNKHKIFTITKFEETIKDYNYNKHPFRGVSIEILFYQEVESFFSVTFSFHKGQTYIETNQVPKLSKKEKGKLTFNAIWRN